jgi:hypothetical protein
MADKSQVSWISFTGEMGIEGIISQAKHFEDGMGTLFLEPLPHAYEQMESMRTYLTHFGSPSLENHHAAILLPYQFQQLIIPDTAQFCFLISHNSLPQFPLKFIVKASRFEQFVRVLAHSSRCVLLTRGSEHRGNTQVVEKMMVSEKF